MAGRRQVRNAAPFLSGIEQFSGNVAGDLKGFGYSHV